MEQVKLIFLKIFDQVNCYDNHHLKILNHSYCLFLMMKMRHLNLHLLLKLIYYYLLLMLANLMSFSCQKNQKCLPCLILRKFQSFQHLLSVKLFLQLQVHRVQLLYFLNDVAQIFLTNLFLLLNFNYLFLLIDYWKFPWYLLMF